MEYLFQRESLIFSYFWETVFVVTVFLVAFPCLFPCFLALWFYYPLPFWPARILLTNTLMVCWELFCIILFSSHFQNNSFVFDNLIVMCLHLDFFDFFPIPLGFLNLTVHFLPPKNDFGNYFFKKAFCPSLASSGIPDAGLFDGVPLVPLAFVTFYLSLDVLTQYFHMIFFCSFLLTQVWHQAPLVNFFNAVILFVSSKICFIVFYLLISMLKFSFCS